MLRAYVTEDGAQRILENAPRYAVRRYDLRGADEAAVDAHLRSIRDELGHQHIDITSFPCFDIRATILDDGAYRLHISFDLTFVDAGSVPLMNAELGVLYDDLSGASLPPLRLNFRDYLLAYRRFKASKRYAVDKAYWIDRLGSFPSTGPELPTQCQLDAIERPVFERCEGFVPAHLVGLLSDVGDRWQVTPTCCAGGPALRHLPST